MGLDEIYEQLEKAGCEGNAILFEAAAKAIAEVESLKQSLAAQTRISDELQKRENEKNQSSEVTDAKKNQVAEKNLKEEAQKTRNPSEI